MTTASPWMGSSKSQLDLNFIPCPKCTVFSALETESNAILTAICHHDKTRVKLQLQKLQCNVERQKMPKNKYTMPQYLTSQVCKSRTWFCLAEFAGSRAAASSSCQRDRTASGGTSPSTQTPSGHAGGSASGPRRSRAAGTRPSCFSPARRERLHSRQPRGRRRRRSSARRRASFRSRAPSCPSRGYLACLLVASASSRDKVVGKGTNNDYHICTGMVENRGQGLKELISCSRGSYRRGTVWPRALLFYHGNLVNLVKFCGYVQYF